jgi:hypothetical protein
MASHLRFFFRQCAYALAFFSVIAIAAEYFVPASVAPFLDPVPVGLIALFFLIIDAFLSRESDT